MVQYEAEGNLIRLHSISTFRFQVPQGETVNSVQMFAYVLDCISMLFQKYVPSIGARPLIIINSPNADCPICHRDIQIIQLTTAPTLWCQIAYQYAHELCHYSISSEVSDNLRWFEESICEMASLYFLQQIGMLWRNSNVGFQTASGETYAFSFIEYAANTSNKFVAFDLKDHQMIHYFESNCYDRLRNRYVANQLLPIFTEYPKTWEAVPSLCRVVQPTFAKALGSWICESPPSARPGLLRIQSLF